jgi:hypothetical protein
VPKPISPDIWDEVVLPNFSACSKKNQSIKYLTEEEIPRLFAVIRGGGSVRDVAIFDVGYGPAGERGGSV